MTHLSEHDLWGAGSNRVTTMAPGSGDLFVVTTLGGRRVFVEPVAQYARALRIAEGFARRIVHDRPVTIRVLPMSSAELLAHMGHATSSATQLPGDSASDRQLIIDTCITALRECDDLAVRKDAYNLLTTLGVMKP